MNPTFVYNQAKNGIELTFPSIPSKDTREQMKTHGFRYHRGKNIWYARHNEDRESFARALCGKDSIAKEAPEQESLFRYYSRRPVDLGTFPKQDGSPVNIVNFDSRINVEDGNTRAWGYVEYAKPLSQKDIDDYELTASAKNPSIPAMDAEKQREKKTAEKKSVKPPKEVKKNVFADHYDKIGDSPIFASGDVDLYTHNEVFVRDLNIQYRRFSGGDSVYITELENAGRNGKTCDKFSLYMGNRASNDSVTCRLYNDFDIRTISQLYAALKEGKDLGSEIQVSKREVKGIEVFSPFVETKPLSKIPDRWTKRNFTNALLSGQIYGGQIDQILTDDYRYDAATNFREGTPINIVCAARNAMEDWSNLASVRATDVKPDGTCKLDYYNGYSTSKTFFFDLHCDIKEGKRREEEKDAGIQRHNEMMMGSCINVSADSIDPGKIYTLITVDTYTNSGIYGTEKENLQGHVLKERLAPDHLYMHVLGCTEMDIQPDKLYSVSNFHHRRSDYEKPDDRIVDCGNWQNIVTGKALLELTGEGFYFPDIQESYGEYGSYELAHKTLESFASGRSRFMLGHNSTDYNHSLACLEKEFARAAAKRSLSDVIRDAQMRSGDANRSGREGKVVER